MSRQFGKWFQECPVCEQEYVLTNYMRRTTKIPGNGYVSTDTHVIACKRKAQEALIPKED